MKACAEKIVPWYQWVNNWPGWLRSHMDRKHTKGGKRKTRKLYYFDMPCAFDIETSKVAVDAAGNPQSIMYIWQWQSGLDCTVVGRTWDEYKAFLQSMSDAIQAINDETCRDWKIVVFVHNLGHEFQYLSGIFPFASEDVFASKPRKVLKATCGAVEYRCSMRHSNQSLDSWSHQLNVPHAKKTGDLDYSIVRYPWTHLTDREIGYCVNDVRAVVECVLAEMDRDGDDLYTIPLTRTGYVRRDARKAMYNWGINRVRRLLPSWKQYLDLRDAFRGGDTHANRYYAGIKIHDVHSVDMSSAYPGVQLECKFPMSPLVEAQPSVRNLYIHMRHKHACLAVLYIEGLKQKDPSWGMPYIPLAKCRHARDYINDNGRLLECGSLEITLTDIDIRIMAKEYKWTGMKVLRLYTARYDYLPKEFRDVIEGYYVKKTTLKGVAGQEQYYIKSKNDLNSCYGMTAQDPLQLDTIYFDGDWTNTTDDPESIYNASLDHAFLPYQWAVWTTAHTRQRLKVAQWAAGDRCIYCDTDSVKYVGDIDLNQYNAAIRSRAERMGAFADDPAGKRHYMGVYEQERDYTEFKTWGAKKYATTYKNGGPITTTIAGVRKTRGGLELALWGGFDAFKPGFTFCAAAGNLVVYNDHPTMKQIEVDGHVLPITRNLAICDNTYTVGITSEYAGILGFKPFEPVYENQVIGG